MIINMFWINEKYQNSRILGDPHQIKLSIDVDIPIFKVSIVTVTEPHSCCILCNNWRLV